MRTLALVLLAGCASADGRPLPEGRDTDEVVDTDVGDTDDTDGEPPCEPVGTVECPIVVDAWPYTDARDTSEAPSDVVDDYSCSPGTDESGGELWYRLDIPEGGALIASVDDVSGDGVDIDLHLLDAPEGSACRVRDNVGFSWIVAPGTYWLVADTWVDGGGEPQAGPYTLTLDLLPMPSGACSYAPQDLRMFWEGCAPGIDCDDSGSDVLLRTPSYGPVVGEAHLVTVADDFGGGWPTSFTDGIAAHYALSEAATGYVDDRSEPWAPAGEGGSEFGQGSTGAYLPVLDEAWYVNMYWRDRPAKGTRLLVWNPENGRMVVASGGYETGPGANDAIGGAVEEIHHALGTGHRDGLVMGFAADQGLPLGPIDCP